MRDKNKKKQKISLQLVYFYYSFFKAIEALPLDLQRNFTLMRELDGYAQGTILSLLFLS
jgi:hypothetical protein